MATNQKRLSWSGHDQNLHFSKTLIWQGHALFFKILRKWKPLESHRPSLKSSLTFPLGGTSAILRGVRAINLGPPMHILGNFFPQFSIFQKKISAKKKNLCEAMYSGGENRIKYLSNRKEEKRKDWEGNFR
jgi:hypothetical protein